MAVSKGTTMIIAAVIGSVCAGSLIVFAVAAARAPTLDYMPDSAATDRMVADLRAVSAAARRSTRRNGTSDLGQDRKAG